MAKQRRVNEQKHVCGDCLHGVADMKFENLSVKGEPTLVACPFQIGRKRVVSEMACGFFEPKK